MIGAIGVLAGMDVLLADLGEGLMIRRLGARNLARPARRPGYLTAMFFLIARSLVFGIALLLTGPSQATKSNPIVGRPWPCLSPRTVATTTREDSPGVLM